MKIAIAIAFLTAAVAQPCARGADIPPLKYTEKTLSNGLHFIYLEDHTAPTAAIQVWYRVGSKDDPAGRSGFANHGQRVVEGQRLLQASSDILLGWLRATGLDGREREFYLRQLWDGKMSAVIEQMTPKTLGIYAQLCGWTLARGHSRSGDRIAIASYLGASDSFDRAIADFSTAYADQNERDYANVAGALEASSVAPAVRS